jgi:DNA-binding cell septation regulator SpoVG
MKDFRTNGLEITDITVNERKSGRLHGYADITLNGMVEIRGFKIFRDENGNIEIDSPARKGSTQYFKIVNFIRTEFKEYIRRKVESSIGHAIAAVNESYKVTGKG